MMIKKSFLLLYFVISAKLLCTNAQNDDKITGRNDPEKEIIPTRALNGSFATSRSPLPTVAQFTTNDAIKMVFPDDAKTSFHGIKQKVNPLDTGSISTVSSLQSNTFEDDTELFSEEELSNNADSTKPNVVDNEAIEELVHQFLSSDVNDDEKEQKVNKEAFELINSSKYWNVENLQPENSIKDSKKAKEWIDGYAIEAQKMLKMVASAGWNYVTSASRFTKQFLDEAEETLSKFVKAGWKQAKQFDVSAIEDLTLKRQLELLLVEGVSVLDENDFNEYVEIKQEIAKNYAETTVCEMNSTALCSYRISDIASIIANENDATRALHFWISWRDTLGSEFIAEYDRLIKLINKGAILNGFPDGGAMWRSPYDLSTPFIKDAKLNDIIGELQQLYQKINPFYKQLHAYIRRQIAALYGITNVPGLTQDGPIPAHLLKSIAGENWLAFYPDTKPFQDEDTIVNEVQENFQKLNYTAKIMFKQAYKMFKGLGFGKLPATFWSKSIFTRTWSKDMLCQPPAAYNMRNGSDFRIKACAQLNLPNFEMAHRLLVHIYYYYLYSQQPLLFQEATNPSFLTALKNAFAINARNVDYLKMMKLIAPETTINHSQIVNRLYLEALKDFVRLPFDLVVDMWRFHIFDGTSTNATWNDDWWQLSEFYQGIKPPVERKKTNFDAMASSTVAQIHAPAIKHLFAYIIQFQILQALCHNATNLSGGCLVQSSRVTENIKMVMALGCSVTWREALKIITGSGELDATAMLNYYQPLIKWLEETNAKDHAYIGWDGPGRPFTESDVPKLREKSTDSSSLVGLFSGNHYAFPGGDCSNGKECLLDSVCQNSTCKCKEGLYTLEIGNTYNCVPDNPAAAGFGDGHGGLIIGLHPLTGSETTSNPENLHTAESTKTTNLDDLSLESKQENKGISESNFSLQSLLLPLAVILFTLM